MKVLKPSYYDEFECIAGDCPDSCCAGWEVLVDDDHAKEYLSHGGVYKENLYHTDEGWFIKRKNGRCAFLMDDNLCYLYKDLGGDKLCETCDKHPRFENNFGGYTEKGYFVSCPVSSKLILRERTYYTETKEDIPIIPNEINPDVFNFLKAEREKLYSDIYDESRSVPQLLDYILELGASLQKGIRRKKYVPLKPLRKVKEKDIRKTLDKMSHYHPDFVSRLDKGQFSYENDTLLRHLIAYYVFRYFLSAAFDGDIQGMCKMIVFCVKTTCFIAGGFDDFVKCAAYVSREIEHADYTIDFYKENL